MGNYDKNLLDRIATSDMSGEAAEFIPADAPFADDQRAWLNGMFSGLQTMIGAALAEDAQAQAAAPLKIFFGSQSGTSESLAKDLRKFAVARGFEAAIAELDSISPAELANIPHLLIVAATFGEGDPTDNAQNFYTALMAGEAPQLPATLNFSVCGMGDSSYAHFNKVGRDLDARLAELGATRAAPMAVCDVDYDDDFAQWKTEVFASHAFKSVVGDARAPLAPLAEPRKAGFDKTHPFVGTLLETRCLNGTGSAKTVNHVEISLSGGGEDMAYAPGDALGVWPVNDIGEVDALLAAGGFSGSETVVLKSGPSSLSAALLKQCDLATVTTKAAEAWGVNPRVDDQVPDVLAAGIDGLTPQAFVDGLRALQPRLYSISSSPGKHPGEVHLTVGEVHYELNGTPRRGVASTYLGQRLARYGSVGVYVHRSSHFHLPEDDATPLIMIGPGTGIAPFRAFLEEREIRGASGQNWLFFGDRHQQTDFLYRDDITAWQESGLLSKTSLAWSRDGADKVYVQHLIRQEGAVFFDWLEKGAAIFVCGDASRMAADVDQAIREVIAEFGGVDTQAADKYVDDLKSAGRYQRDVY